MDTVTVVKNFFVCMALTAVTYLAITTAQVEVRTAKHADAVLMRVGDAIDNVNAITKKINAPGGLLQVTGKTVAKADNVLGHADILIANEQTSLTNWNKQISETLGNVNNSVVAFTNNQNEITKDSAETLKATTDSVKAVKPLVDSLNAEAQELKTTTASINTLVGDPEIKETITNIAGTTKDVSHVVHEYVYPGPWQRVWNAVTGVGLDIGKFFLP